MMGLSPSGRATLGLAIAASLSTAACASTPPLEAQPLPQPPAPAPAPAALGPEEPARWIRSVTGSPSYVPWGDGHVALLGGRRLLLGGDGSVRTESAPVAGRLNELLVVPSAGGPRLFGLTLALLRLDDPVGPPVVLAWSSHHKNGGTAPGPGFVAVWDAGVRPDFVDVATGALRQGALPGLPEHRTLRALAFHDMREGAVMLHGSGLWLTRDGGATFQPVAEAVPGETRRFNTLRVVGNTVVAVLHTGQATIDFAAGKLGPPEPVPAASAPPLLAWIDRARTDGLGSEARADPLAQVAAEGVRTASGSALVASSSGLVARVDPATGAVLELVPVPGLGKDTRCQMRGAGNTAWVGCQSASRPLEIALHRIALDAPKLALGAPIVGLVAPSGDAFRALPGGRVMTSGACPSTAAKPPSACIFQPDGAPQPAAAYGDGLLADGRVAVLRTPAPGNRGAREGDAGQGTDADLPALALVDAAGREQRLAPLRLFGPDDRDTWVAIKSSVEEDDAHVLHFVIGGDRASHRAWVVRQEPGGEPTARRFAGASLHGRHGIAFDAGHLYASSDFGGSWTEIPAPPEVLADAARSLQLGVSDFGATVGEEQLRLGWGAPQPIAPEPPRLQGGTALDSDKPPSKVPPMRSLVCTTLGPAVGVGGTPSDTHDVRKLLGQIAPAEKRGERPPEVDVFPDRGMRKPLVMLEVRKPAAPGKAAGTWTLRWLDAAEMGAQPRSASGPAPFAVGSPDRMVKEAVAAGGHLVALVDGPGSRWLVHAGPRGDLAAVALPSAAPWPENLVLGADGSSFWTERGTAHRWTPGQPPKVLATYWWDERESPSSGPALGVPARDGVPLWWAARPRIFRVLPLAPASGPPYLPIQGWSEHDVVWSYTLPACTKKPLPTREILVTSHFKARVDGVAESGEAEYRIRVGGAPACVAAVRADIYPDDPNAAPPQPGGPVGFVRADLITGKAEGSGHGVEGKLRRLACALADGP
jgi:hypothetical protein